MRKCMLDEIPVNWFELIRTECELMSLLRVKGKGVGVPNTELSSAMKAKIILNSHASRMYFQRPMAQLECLI